MEKIYLILNVIYIHKLTTKHISIEYSKIRICTDQFYNIKCVLISFYRDIYHDKAIFILLTSE